MNRTDDGINIDKIISVHTSEKSSVKDDCDWSNSFRMLTVLLLAVLCA